MLLWIVHVVILLTVRMDPFQNYILRRLRENSGMRNRGPQVAECSVQVRQISDWPNSGRRCCKYEHWCGPRAFKYVTYFGFERDIQ